MAAKVTRATIEERWRCQLRDVQRFVGEPGFSPDVSARYSQINDGLEELAAFLVDEVRGDLVDGSGGLDELMDGLWDEIERRMVAWAVEVETRRSRKAAAA